MILSGVKETTPLNKVYFLQASPTGVSGAQDPARWTFFSLCGVVNGLNGNCRPVQAALPFDPPRNFGTEQGLPQRFVGTHYYYYISRFMFAFYLIALFFSAVAWVMAIVALALNRIGSVLAGLMSLTAFAFQGLATSLMTYVSRSHVHLVRSLTWTVHGLSKVAIGSAHMAKMQILDNMHTASLGARRLASSSAQCCLYWNSSLRDAAARN